MFKENDNHKASKSRTLLLLNNPQRRVITHTQDLIAVKCKQSIYQQSVQVTQTYNQSVRLIAAQTLREVLLLESIGIHLICYSIRSL